MKHQDNSPKLIDSWETIRHQVTISGLVRNKTGDRLKGLPVTLVAMPEQMVARVLAKSSSAEGNLNNLDRRLDRTLTRNDGSFFFLDLPEGNYTLRVIDAVSGLQDEKKSIVKWSKNGSINRALVSFQLSES